MNKSLVYTIGYGSRPVADFASLLVQHGVRVLVDIRSKPFSKYNPDYCRQPLLERLAESGIRYSYLGDQLGGQPDDPSLYTNNRVDYEKMKHWSVYQKGISRLSIMLMTQSPLAIMCSEGKPEDCHRSKLVGQSLTEMGIEVIHIDENGHDKSQERVMNGLMGPQPALFGVGLMSRKRYLK